MSEESTTHDDLKPKAKAPDHGEDPRRVPGTPQAAEAEALGDPAFDEAPSGYVDLQMRKRVNKRKAKGLVCRMGPDFENGLIRIRPWSARPMQIFRETYEKRLRSLNPKLSDGDDLEPEDVIELNRATAVMCIQGLDLKVWLAPGEKAELDMPEIDDEDGIKAHRKFASANFLVPYDPKRPESANEIDMDFLALVMNLQRGLSKVRYQEIDQAGEGFVFGATEKLDYGDSNR